TAVAMSCPKASWRSMRSCMRTCAKRVRRARHDEQGPKARADRKDRAATRSKIAAHSRRLAVSSLDRTAEARLVRRPVVERAGPRLPRFVDAAARALGGGRAVSPLRQVGAIAGDERGAVAGRAMAGHDDGGVERLQPVEAREPVLQARTRAGKGRLVAH